MVEQVGLWVEDAGASVGRYHCDETACSQGVGQCWLGRLLPTGEEERSPGVMLGDDRETTLLGVGVWLEVNLVLPSERRREV